MSNEKFSVSMCVYGENNPKWFKTAVESVLNQTVKPDEIVLVVDGPVPDDLAKIISFYEEQSEFNVIKLPENLGHGEARRIGLENCSNELVALMDADDISVENRFEIQLKMFNDFPELSVVGGNITEFIDSPENIVGKRIVPENDIEIKEYMKKRCPMNQVTVMFKKSLVDKAGGYIDWFCEEDYYLWLRMSFEGMLFANVPQNLVNVRVGEDMYNRRGGMEYFKSEAKLQKYMFKNKVIGLGRFLVNITERFIIQILLPNKLRGWVFKKFARE